MCPKVQLFFAVMILFLCSVTPVLAQSTCQYGQVPGEYLFKLRDANLNLRSTSSLNRKAKNVVKKLGFKKLLKSYPRFPGLYLSKSDRPLSNARKRSVLTQGELEYIEPNCYRKASLTPNDLSSTLWGLNQASNVDIDAPEGWDYTTGSNSVIVGVLDTGIYYTHPDLAANVWTNPLETSNGADDDGNGYIDDIHGVNTITGSGNPLDDDASSSHGTHVSGTIGAVGNNGTGLVGVNWNVALLGLKFISGTTGTGSIADEIQAIQYVIDLKTRGENIVAVNASFGSTDFSSTERDAIATLGSLGIMFIAAAGNEANNNDIIPTYPAGYDLSNIISVAAIDQSGNRASFSNYGATSVDIAAPGVDIRSTRRGTSYQYLSGTSMATPFVTGAVALLKAYDSSLSISEIRDAILENYKPLSSLSGLVASPGILDLDHALESISCPGIGDDGINAPNRPSGDADGDGIIDSEELTEGSNPSDRGSYAPDLKSPVFTPWNGFLGMTNILEITNPSNVSTTASVSLYRQDGTFCSRVSFNLSAHGQQDVILNDMRGFRADNYGLAKIVFSGSTEARAMIYRTENWASGTYDFVFTTPFTNSIYGPTTVSFNTYQPSFFAGDQSNLVTNWLTVINLSTDSKNFTVNYYLQNGTLLLTENIALSAKGRQDIQGGHVNPGANNVGLIEIVPADNDAPYLAQLTRYGYGSDGTSYVFAHPLQARSGTGEALIVPISSTLNAQNWLELINTAGTSQNVDLDLRDNLGSSLFSGPVNLPARGQVHINMNDFLGTERTGSAMISPTLTNSVISQSMYYFRDSSGRIISMYGSPARQSFFDETSGSYNLFLTEANWLKLTNTTLSSVSADVEVFLPTGGSTLRNLTLPARSSTDLGLHESSFGTALNTYGLVKVTTALPGSVYGEILRVRSSAIPGEPDFIVSTTVR